MNYLLIFALLCLAQTGVYSSHFRGGFISYKVTGPLTVQFTISHAWRSDAPDYIGFQFGDNSYTTYGYENQVFAGLDSEGEAYKVFRIVANHTYPRAGVYYAYWESCCRIYTVLNSASSDFRVRAVVDLTAAAPVDSPSASLPPLIQVPISATSTYDIGVADPNGFTCALTAYGDSLISGFASINSNAISVSPSCQLSWNSAAGRIGDKYAVSVSVYQAGTQTVVPLDFIVELIPLSYLPTFEVEPYDPVVVLGQAFTVTVIGTSGRPNVNQLTLSVLGLAGDATVTPPPYTTGDIPYRVFFTSAAQIPGSFTTVLVFTDPDNYQSTYTISYSVIKPSECAEVSFQSCSTLHGLTYYSFNSNPVATYELKNNCSGTYLSQNGSFSFTSTQAGGPDAVCNFKLFVTQVISGSTNVANCSLSLHCPLCNSVSQIGTVRTVCRNDSAPVYTVAPADSVDKFFAGDVLATAVDADGAIISTTTSALPPGVGVRPDGTIYVTSRPDLIEGTYTVTVTNTDVFGDAYTQTVTIVFLHVVCGVGLQKCGAACYDPAVLTCVTGPNQRLLCPIGSIFCPNSTNTCYNPTQNVCNGGTLCAIGTAICGSACYPPSGLTCNHATDGSYVLCPTTLAFCGTGCYDPNVYNCRNGALEPKGINYCNGIPFDDNIYDCVSHNFICPKHYSVCGAACYLPSEYTCQPNFMLCRFGQELCGTTCYDDTLFDCIDETTGTIAPIN